MGKTRISTSALVNNSAFRARAEVLVGSSGRAIISGLSRQTEYKSFEEARETLLDLSTDLPLFLDCSGRVIPYHQMGKKRDVLRCYRKMCKLRDKYGDLNMQSIVEDIEDKIPYLRGRK